MNAIRKYVPLAIALAVAAPHAAALAQAGAATARQATQTATTASGRKVILQSDGTWQYADQTRATGTGTLVIEAGLVFNSGDAKPVARTEFLLLESSFTSLVLSAEIIPPRKVESLSADEQVLFNLGMSVRFAALAELATFQEQVLTLARAHTKYSGTTDFGGKLTISGIAPGRYFLFGYFRGGESAAVWNLPVQVGRGQSSVVLDNKNASIY